MIVNSKDNADTKCSATVRFNPSNKLGFGFRRIGDIKCGKGTKLPVPPWFWESSAFRGLRPPSAESTTSTRPQVFAYNWWNRPKEARDRYTTIRGPQTMTTPQNIS